MFEKASRLKLRFDTERGIVSCEDLWDLSLQELNRIAKALNKDIKSLEEEDFLEDVNAEDAIVKLKFKLVIYILDTKKEERRKLKEAVEIKAKKEKILCLIAKKQDGVMEEKSVEELMAELDSLDN